MLEDATLVSLLVIGGWVVSLCLHEFGHGFAAYLGGDTSVKEKGYLSFNPFAYTQIGLSIILPTIFVLLGGIGLPGAAVQVDRSKLRNKGWFSIVAAAGPLFTLIFIGILAYAINSIDMPRLFYSAFSFLMLLEWAVFVLNLIPLPGLDGFGIIEPFLPESTKAKLTPLYKYGFFILLAALWVVPPVNDALWTSAAFLAKQTGVHGSAVMDGYSLYRKGAMPIAVGVIAIAAIVHFARERKDLKKRANKLAEQKQWQAAIDVIDELIKTKEDDEAWRLKAACYAELARAHQPGSSEYESLRASALESINRGIALNPASAINWLTDGLIHHSFTDLTAAHDAYKKALEIDPALLPAVQNTIVILLYENRHEELLEVCRKFLTHVPQNGEITFQKAVAEFILERYEDCIKTLEHCIVLNYSVDRCWYNKACCYARLAEVDKAIDCLRLARDKNPDGDAKNAAVDPDLFPLHGDERFQKEFMKTTARAD